MATKKTKNAKKTKKTTQKDVTSKKKPSTSKTTAKKSSKKNAAKKKAGAWKIPAQTRADDEDTCWLVKSEPDVFSFADLVKEPKKTAHWDGVRNYTARNFMRDAMRKGDPVLFYHSNTKPPHVAGLCRVVKEGYPDPTAFDPREKYFDPKSKRDAPRWFVVDVKAVKALTPVSLDDMKANPNLEEMLVVQRGQRLSVQPVSRRHLHEVLRMGGVQPDDVGV